MTRVETARQLRWLMSLRVVTLATLLICAFGIEVLLRPSESLRPLVLLAACSFAMVLGYALLDRWFGHSRVFVLLQLFGDAVVISFFVQITGGLDSPMSFLYLLPISAGSILLYRSGGLAMAGICWSLYLALAALGSTWVPFGALVPLSPETDPGRTVYLLVAHLVAMLAFAILSSSLSERLRSQGRELAERQQAVARLTALNENIIESINSGLITTDLSGSVNFMNRGGSEIIGFPQVAVEGREIEALFDLGSGFLGEIRRQLLAERRFRFERWFDREDGQRIFLGIAASNLHDKAGRPLGYIFIFQDLTEIHALEQEVRLRERMVALGEMSAGMAHELRNPLASISGAVQYLKGDLKPSGERLELMDIILRESHRLDQAIRDFLTFTRPGKFAPEAVDLVKLLEDSLKLLERSHEKQSAHRLETRFPAARLDCELDANRMKQVFWNLTTNALKAMPDGGTLMIGVEIDHAQSRIEISFHDQGVGMDRRQREQYFQPFSSSFSEGTGLGAAIVYRLVEEHGGRIRLTSSKGRGTCVTISLPYRVPSAAPADEPAPRFQAAGG
jgi:two-component system sensor histidine kinase PilS (NtrC family)